MESEIRYGFYYLFFYIIIPLLIIHSTFKIRAILKRRSIFNSLPGPKLHPIFGTLNLYSSNEEGIRNILAFHKEHQNDKFFRFRTGPFGYVVGLVDPELIGKVLSMDPSRAPKLSSAYKIMSKFLGYGILIINYERWFKRRRMLTPAFHMEVIESYMPTFNDCVDVLLRKWTEQIDKGNETMDVYGDSTRFTLDVMLRCACSYVSDCQLEDSSNSAKEYISAIFDSSRISVKQILHLPYHLPFYFSLSPTGKRWRQVCRRIKDESVKIVKKRRQDLLSGKESVKTRPDFIDILLSTQDSTGATLSDTDITSEMNTFLFEGHDTTASGVAWTLYSLSRQPDIQKQCRNEIRSVLGGRERVEWADLKSLEFTSMCIKEAMRLYPPVPWISRVISEDLQVDDYVIPKGTTVGIYIMLMHRHPKYWDNPDEYDPTRFYDEKPGRSNFSYIPFSAGHRNCIGQKFALTEEVITIARIVNKFELEYVPQEVRRLPHLILKPEGGLRVKLRLAN